jgi:hypothetical protein
VERIRDAIRLLAVVLTAPVSRRAVRPCGDEARRALAGDELLPSTKLRWTQAITIRARPAEIWP